MPTYPKVWVKGQTFKHLSALGLGSKEVILSYNQMSPGTNCGTDLLTVLTLIHVLSPISSNIFDYVDHEEPKYRLF